MSYSLDEIQTLIFGGQLLLLAASVHYAKRYVESTERIKEAAIQQSKVSADQVESMSRPVLVMKAEGTTVQLVNVGTGPALNVEWWPWPEQHPEGRALPARNAPSGRHPYIESHTARETGVNQATLMAQKAKIIVWYKLFWEGVPE
ncbi:MAG TPA: hypothetical protein VNK82_05865 [Terriglobales bacterium]|nr:hypothetical protein [Terriglobales bacterium]